MVKKVEDMTVGELVEEHGPDAKSTEGLAPNYGNLVDASEALTNAVRAYVHFDVDGLHQIIAERTLGGPLEALEDMLEAAKKILSS